jgi:putative ABC transport system permease protein
MMKVSGNERLSNEPPKFMMRFFRWFCHPDLLRFIEGDLYELYNERVSRLGKRRADLRFVIDVLLLLRPGIVRQLPVFHNQNNFDMLKNYLLIAFRSIRLNKSYSAINISGLAIGMAACLLIVLYVFDELKYDRHHVDLDRLYRIASETTSEKWVAAPAPMAEALTKDFPEVEESTRLLRFPGAENMLVKDEKGENQFIESQAYYVDATFFRVFSFDFIHGNSETALVEPNTVVLAESTAQKYFGDEDPIGKTLNIGLSFGNLNYTVKGVFRDKDVKSHVPAKLLLSMNNSDVGAWVKMQTAWASNSIFHTYVKLRPGADAKHFESKLDGFLNLHGGEEFKAAGFEKHLFIQPVKDIYLHSNYGYEIASNGNIKNLFVLGSIASFLLIIACINFMNLSTARSERRAREVGLRRVNGARKGGLISQFLVESLVMSVLALITALVLIQLSLPAFNQIAGKTLSFLDEPSTYIALGVLTLATGLFSGLYPAFYLSSFKPLSIIKTRKPSHVSAIAIRKGLVVFQFAVSTMLIIGVMLITQQMHFIEGQNLGFNKEQKIVLPLQTSESLTTAEVFKNSLLANSNVSSVAVCGSYPGTESITSMLFYADGKKAQENVDVKTMYVETDYLKTLDIQLLSGRDFSLPLANDQGRIVINEVAARQLGFTAENAPGKKIHFDLNNQTFTLDVIGVVKDYHYQSLHEKIKPLALLVAPFFAGPNRFVIASVNTSDYSTLLDNIKQRWSSVNPGSPFSYSFVDQDFQKNYEKEQRTQTLVQYFTIIAIVIACLGLFGLATFTAEQRVKEIGVRKVLGASVLQLVTSLSKDIIKLVVIAIIVASPIAYYFMDQWLGNFAYHINIEWWTFIAAATITILLALGTICYQTIRASLANPVDSLRSE